MHWLFMNDYLVHEICSYVPKSELPVLARVSSTWFKCAVSHLYSNVAIYDALAPLGKIIQKDNTIKFTKPPSNEDVRRLLKYTIHVRELDMYSDHAFVAIQAMRKHLSKDIPYIFPNARFLIWSLPKYSLECMEVAVGLISPNIKRLGLSLFINDNQILHYLKPLVTTRLSVLHSLIIKDYAAKSSFTEPMQNILDCFSHTLTLVKISLSLNTPSIAKCLSKMPNLRSLSIGEFVVEELKSCAVCGDTERFPSLRVFSFDGPPESFHDLFLSPYGLSSLTALYLNVEITPNELQTLVLALVVACPCISTLSIGKEDSDEDSEDAAENNRTPMVYLVPWSFIQPISSCKKLKTLSLENMLVWVNLEELAEFLKTRTTWTSLYIMTSRPMQLKDMLLYAKHCPYLEHLGMYVNEGADEFSSCVKDLPSDSELPKFSTLISIDFCRSFTSSNLKRPTFSFNLAQFLYRVCQNPPSELIGLSEQIVEDVWRNLAILYVNEHCRTGVPMSNEVGEFIRRVLKPES